jgi:hypothetical protein
MPGSVIVGGARTPVGKLSGALEGFLDLGGIASTSLLLRIADRRYLRAHCPGCASPTTSPASRKSPRSP